MLFQAIPKLPMRDRGRTVQYYESLGFVLEADYGDYLIVARDRIELHFFLFEALDPEQNDGQVYIRTDDVEAFYTFCLSQHVPIHPNAPLADRPWGQREFALLDPDHNLLTFGQSLDEA